MAVIQTPELTASRVYPDIPLPVSAAPSLGAPSPELTASWAYPDIPFPVSADPSPGAPPPDYEYVTLPQEPSEADSMQETVTTLALENIKKAEMFVQRAIDTLCRRTRVPDVPVRYEEPADSSALTEEPSKPEERAMEAAGEAGGAGEVEATQTEDSEFLVLTKDAPQTLPALPNRVPFWKVPYVEVVGTHTKAKDISDRVKEVLQKSDMPISSTVLSATTYAIIVSDRASEILSEIVHYSPAIKLIYMMFSSASLTVGPLHSLALMKLAKRIIDQYHPFS